MENLIRRGNAATFSSEYGCRLRRLFPWPDRAETKRQLTELGLIWVILESGDAVPAHAHDEEEAFIVISGIAELTIDNTTTTIETGDVAYIPRNTVHSLRNPDRGASFAMIDLYWDLGGRPHQLQSQKE